MKNYYGEITQYIYRLGLWFFGSALSLSVIYVYVKFYLNATCSCKVICRIRYRTDGQSGDYMLLPLGSITTKGYELLAKGESILVVNRVRLNEDHFNAELLLIKAIHV